MSEQNINRWAVAAAVGGATILLASALAGLGSRWGWWHFSTGFDILRWAAYACFLVVLLALFALTRRRGWPLALFGLIAALVVLANGWLMMRKARSVPAIHDITTDTNNPPAFVAVLPLRADAPNSAAYEGAEIAAQQKEAYPDVVPLRLPIPAQQAFARALDEAEDMGWTIVQAAPAEGRIEATARTFWFGFKDDVVVRITPADGGSIVDVRSVSRVGRGDVGANAARIREYLDELRD
ncbi:MAG TPA: DUF1499 domain-containing protein [Longimicrobiales bacterium]|nr:DUF1499 domain-containing protein [Longimicrobiales bacterium]